jgi:hypothetical protein
LQRIVSEYESLTLKGWDPSTSKQKIRRYQNAQDRNWAAEILSMCGAKTKSEGTSLPRLEMDKDEWYALMRNEGLLKETMTL